MKIFIMQHELTFFLHLLMKHSVKFPHTAHHNFQHPKQFGELARHHPIQSKTKKKTSPPPQYTIYQTLIHNDVAALIARWARKSHQEEPRGWTE